MWWATVLAAAVVIVAQQFNPNDNSDFVDNVDDENDPSAEFTPRWVSDTVATKGGKRADIQREVEKLLGKPIIHYEYEEPADESTRGPMRSARPSRDQPSLQSDMHWSDPLEVLGLSSLKPRRWRHRTNEVIYSVRVPQSDDSVAQFGQKIRPGVMERLDNPHDVVRYQPPRNPPPHNVPTRSYPAPTRTPANPTVYNEGGIRSTQYHQDNLLVLPLISTDGRRLLTVPGAKLTATTRPPRPTPITNPIEFSYLYTRRTRRHPNCTDTYYDCLLKCFDRRGYRRKCPWDTTTTAEPRRMNFTGLFWAIRKERRWTDYDVSDLFVSFSRLLIEHKYRECKTFTTRTTTTKPISPIYYDDPQFLGPKTGSIVAKCWVCGLLDTGIPFNEYCSEGFSNHPSSLALAEKNSYRRYCRYMSDVPLWYNRSDPLSLYGGWTGGCSKRWLDLSGMYTQRTCRSVTAPATGQHFLSRRMAMLELSLRDVRDGCVVSPIATLVPFSRAVSLYARFHVCVCSGHFCNVASRKELSLALIMLCLVTIVTVRVGFITRNFS